ncbi:MAG TPA: hypothetical protein VGM49_08320 [Candidatus Limnocylindrales bacterium]
MEAIDLDWVTQAALTVGDVESAVIFVPRPGATALELAAATGIEGPALAGLVTAVQNPMHPVARAVHEAGATFDVQPMNPGGPALRSHLPLDGLGVLAVAHQTSLGDDDRAALERLATTATDLLRR